MGLYIILMGLQGAGKGVQAGLISQTYSIPQVSTGDLFRAIQTREDEFAKRVQAILASGALVDDDTTNEIVADRLSQSDAQNGVILDGYPRNQIQAAFLDQLLAEKNEKINGVLLLKLDLFMAFKRAFGRVTAADGESYNYYYKQDDVQFSIEEHPDKAYPPRMVSTLNGEVLKRRSDDADAMAVVTRIDTYLENTVPVLEYYREQGIVYEINAEQSITDVSTDIQQTIDDMR